MDSAYLSPQQKRKQKKWGSQTIRTWVYEIHKLSIMQRGKNQNSKTLLTSNDMYVIQAHQDWPCCLACRRPVKLQYIFANYMSTKRLCVLLLIALNDHKASGECSVGQTDPNIYCLFMFMYIQHA